MAASPEQWSGEGPAHRRDSSQALPETRPDEGPARYGDAWARIRAGLPVSAPHWAHPRVVREIAWYRKHRGYLHRTAQQARPYLAYIAREVERRGLPLEFALLPIVESGFQPFARSSVGASGLWQFMPATGKIYGLKQNWWYDGRRDVVASTRAALDYLSMLSQDFDGDWLLAVAAYNWGEGNVKRAAARNRAQGKPTDVWSLRVPRETRTTVSRLLAVSAIVADPDRHGVVLAPIPDHVPFEPVELYAQIDLHVATDLAGITLDEIYKFNPGLNPRARATPPGGPHRLHLPRHAVERFRAGLAKTPAGRRVRWTRHDVVRGDTLGAIADRYRTSVAALKRFNRLASDRIIAGSHLMVPVSTPASGEPRPGETARVPRPPRVEAPDAAASIHIVRTGEGLWRIARRHGVDIGQLAVWNGLSMSAVLHPGQRLTIRHRHPGGPRAGRPAAPPPAEPARTPRRLGAVHVVERGDTLFGIARRHGTTVHRLAELNRIGVGAVLHPGQRLRVAPAASADSPAPAPEPGNRGSI